MGVALVTGADTGIGRAIARRLLEEGWALAYATHRRDADAQEAHDSLAARGTVHWVAGDLADPEVPARLVAEAREALGPVDALVNNAGITVALPALEGTAEDFDRIFAIDVRAAFLLARAAAPDMLERGGAIVNITSVHEHAPRPGFALYASAKAALGMLSRGLALELAPFGVRVNSVAPGVILTERVTEADVVSDQVPLGRAGTPEEVAALVAFLLSEEARYITGASLAIDGGLLQGVVPVPADAGARG